MKKFVCIMILCMGLISSVRSEKTMTEESCPVKSSKALQKINDVLYEYGLAGEENCLQKVKTLEAKLETKHKSLKMKEKTLEEMEETHLLTIRVLRRTIADLERKWNSSLRSQQDINLNSENSDADLYNESTVENNTENSTHNQTDSDWNAWEYHYTEGDDKGDGSEKNSHNQEDKSHGDTDYERDNSTVGKDTSHEKDKHPGNKSHSGHGNNFRPIQNDTGDDVTVDRDTIDEEVRNKVWKKNATEESESDENTSMTDKNNRGDNNSQSDKIENENESTINKNTDGRANVSHNSNDTDIGEPGQNVTHDNPPDTKSLGNNETNRTSEDEKNQDVKKVTDNGIVDGGEGTTEKHKNVENDHKAEGEKNKSKEMSNGHIDHKTTRKDFEEKSEVMFYDCEDVKNSGITETGVYTIRVNGTKDVTAFNTSIVCEMDEEGLAWNIAQQRLGQNVDFDRHDEAYQKGFGDVTVMTDFWLGLHILKTMTHARRYSTVKVQLRDNDGNFHSAQWSGKRWFRIGERSPYFENYPLERSYTFNGTDDGLKDLLPEGKFKSSENLKSLLARKESEIGLKHSCNEEVLNGGWWFGIDSNTKFENNSCPIMSNLNAKTPFFVSVPNIVSTWIKFRI